MSGGIALTRAMMDLNGADKLAEMTHLGGNSGGTYFNTQFLLSEGFYRNVTDVSLPLDTLVTDWLAQHIAHMRGLMPKDGPLAQEFGSHDLLVTANCYFHARSPDLCLRRQREDAVLSTP